MKEENLEKALELKHKKDDLNGEISCLKSLTKAHIEIGVTGHAKNSMNQRSKTFYFEEESNIFINTLIKVLEERAKEADKELTKMLNN